MPIVKTEIEWPYKPEGFLEVPLRRVGTGYILTLQEGRAKAVLDQPLDPVPPDLIERILRQVRASLDARQLLLHQSYRLEEGPRIVQHRPDGLSNVTITVGSAVLTPHANSPDIIVTDKDGNVVRDTKAERLTEHGRFITAISEAAERSPLLRSPSLATGPR